MSMLRVYRDDDPSHGQLFTEPDDIAREAARAHLRFERWRASVDLAGVSDPERVLAAYEPLIALLKQA